MTSTDEPYAPDAAASPPAPKSKPPGLRPINEFFMMLPGPLRAELEGAPVAPAPVTPLHPRDRLARAVASIPKAYAWASMKDRAFQALVPSASKVAPHAIEPGALTIVGPQRSGKSTLAAVLFDAWIKNALRAPPGERERALARRGDGRWWSALRLCSVHYAHGHGGGPCEAIEAAMRAPLLVVDGLGRERENAWVLADVLFERHEEKRPTWITTSLTVRELAARYGGDLTTRLVNEAHVFATSDDWGRLHAAPLALLPGAR